MNLDTETEEGRANWALISDAARCVHMMDISSIAVKRAAEELGFEPLDDETADKLRNSIFASAERGLKRHQRWLRDQRK